MSLITVKNLPIFKEVPAKTLDLWLRTFSPRTKAHAKGTVVFLQGQAYTELAIILEGEANAEIQDYGGKVLKVETLKAPEPIATAVIFSPDNALPVTVVAKTDVKILLVPKAELLRLCRLSEAFLDKLLSDMGSRLTLLAQKLRFLQFGTIRRKIAGYFLDEMLKQRSAELKIPYTKEVLAELFGVTRPAFSRVFAELREEGVIIQEGKTVIVRKAQALRRMLEEAD